MESNTNERSLEELGAEVDDAVRQVGIRNFILAPGCAVNSDSPMDLLKHMRRKSESYAPANASQWIGRDEGSPLDFGQAIPRP